MAVASIIRGTKGWALVLTANGMSYADSDIQRHYSGGASLILVALAIISHCHHQTSIAKPIKTLENSARQMAGGDWA